MDVGCYADDRYDRDLPYAQLTNIAGGMTHEICVTHCHNLVLISLNYFSPILMQ